MLGAMSSFYRVLYRIGFTPWEHGLAQAAVAEQISAMYAREEAGRQPPYGRALDLGCGSGIHSVELARRGWQVTGIDLVEQAVERARARAVEARVDVRFVPGDVTDLARTDVGSGYRLLLDFGMVHGLTDEQRVGVARGVDAVAAPDASFLVLAFPPGSRGPLPRGMSRGDIETLYAGWQVSDETPSAGELPLFLRLLRADPRWYRLRRR